MMGTRRNLIKKTTAPYVAASLGGILPAALLAMQAGKHVYLKKPACHNPLKVKYWSQTYEKRWEMKL